MSQSSNENNEKKDKGGKCADLHQLEYVQRDTN